MVIDTNAEEIISLANATKRLPVRRAGKKPHVSTLYRWTDQGCRGVVLESIQIGGTRCTSVEALERFFERLTRAAGLTAPNTSRRKQRRQKDAEQKLDAVGIGA